jgi:uncharacterized protein (DUF885 family)
MFFRVVPTPLKLAAVVTFVLVAGVVAALTFQQIYPSNPALAQDEFDCASFDSQADAQAELRRDPSDPSGLDGPIGTASQRVAEGSILPQLALSALSNQLSAFCFG